MKGKNFILKLLIISFYFISTEVVAQTTLPRMITTNQTWTPKGSPYIITQNTLIDTGVTINIQPGTVVRSDIEGLSIQVGGKIIAIGTDTDPIKFENITLNVSRESPDYEVTTGDGTQFEWCHFLPVGFFYPGLSTINSARIRQCYFYGATCSFSNRSTVNSCEFLGCNLSLHWRASLTNCDLDGVIIKDIDDAIRIENNKFNHFSGFKLAYLDGALITCNLFRNSHDGFIVDGFSDTSRFEFSYNTMDSIGFHHGLPRPAIFTFRISGPFETNFTECKLHHNNFLTNVPGVPKIEVFGVNHDIKTSAHIDVRNNYWGTSDSSEMDALVGDYLDDFKLFATIDYWPILTERDTNCITTKSTCKASYFLARDTTNLFNLYVVNTSKGVTANTKYTWSFGDGTTSGTRRPVHRYNKFGLYELCLTIEDKVAGCESTYCDSIGVDSLGKLLKSDGFTINIIEDKDLAVGQPLSNINEFSVFPNPSSGIINVNVDLAGSEELLIEVLDVTGRKIIEQKELFPNGENLLKVDLGDVNNGLYMIRLHAGRETRMAKVLLSR